MTPIIVWFRRNLRISDNPALHAAVKEKHPLLLVYIADNTDAPWAMGKASLWWLRQSLAAFSEQLTDKYQAPLILLKGDPQQEIIALAQNTQAHAVYWDRNYSPAEIARDTQIKTLLTAQNIIAQSFNCALLHDPWQSQNKSKQPFKVFTPFWKNLKTLAKRDIVSTPAKFKSCHYANSLTLDLALPLPKINWYSEMATVWQPGEKAAKNKLAFFLKNTIKNYPDLRNRPDEDHTSHLSPYLHFGEISPIQIWHASRQVMENSPTLTQDIEKFLAELAWREFSHHLLYYFPQLPDEAFKAQFKPFPWQNDKKLLTKWQQGLTGYPIVDAGMRQLWRTGFMHNRVRMIVASFLIKHLLQPWQAGEAWFWDTLVDADLANNSAAWQWVAGCGADAAPYFRIFNPILQGQKFDPAGLYVKKWVPELATLATKYIHEPWQAPAEDLKKAGVVIGKSYPAPLIEHTKGRERALAIFKQLR